jgi:hypothetical protein
MHILISFSFFCLVYVAHFENNCVSSRNGHNNGHNITAEYFKSSDKRIRFKSGWELFAAKNNMVAGIGALIMFHMTRRGLMISFDIVRY